MARRTVALLTASDLVFPVSDPGFTSLVAQELGTGFPLADDFDAALLTLSTAVSDDLAALSALDELLAELALDDGPIGDGTVDVIYADIAALAENGQPVIDGLLVELGNL